jgi:hypothetical protein
MDPTNKPPDQPAEAWGTAPQPGQPTPPWGTAPEPTPSQQTPSWAAPSESTPPWATPGQPGAPQPGIPTPPWATPGQPTPPWAAPGQPDQPGQPGQPTPPWTGQPWPQVPQKSRGMGKRIAVVAIAAVVVIGGLFAFAMLRGLPDRGKVVFSTDAPTSETTGCTVSHQVTTSSLSTAVYATYIYTATQGSDVVTLTISKDGTEVGAPIAIPTSDTNGADCTAESTNLSTEPGWGTGTWKFTLTAAGKTVSEGSLIVTK